MEQAIHAGAHHRRLLAAHGRHREHRAQSASEVGHERGVGARHGLCHEAGVNERLAAKEQLPEFHYLLHHAPVRGERRQRMVARLVIQPRGQVEVTHEGVLLELLGEGVAGRGLLRERLSDVLRVPLLRHLLRGAAEDLHERRILGSSVSLSHDGLPDAALLAVEIARIHGILRRLEINRALLADLAGDVEGALGRDGVTE